jgi:integrase
VVILKHKETLIVQELRKPTLSPLHDRLRNPLSLSPEPYEQEAVQEASRYIAGKLREQNFIKISHEELRNTEGYIPYNDPDLGISADNLDEFLNNGEFYRRMDTLMPHNKNVEKLATGNRTQAVAEAMVSLKDKVFADKKEELGLINEHDRGKISQMLQDAGATVPENRRLDYHIDQFIEYQKRRQALGKITAGRLEKIIRTIESYRKWSPTVNIDKVGTKEHIDAYHKSLGDRILAPKKPEKIEPEYGNNLFGTFKMFVNRLVREGILKTYPPCLQGDNSKEYIFPVPLRTPKTISLELVQTLLDAAPPQLKLCILLTLNCGFGAGEIGQLTMEEYNPKTGRIIHKRSKTKNHKNAPTVCYKLWDCTKELLDQEIANRKNYPKRQEAARCLLVNRSGNPLWYERFDGTKTSKSDNISCNFKRLVARLRGNDPSFPSISYYQFRKTSASLIYNEPKFRIYNELWLAHSPRSVADRHYNAVEDTILDGCIAWLHDQYFGLMEPVEGEKCQNGQSVGSF